MLLSDIISAYKDNDPSTISVSGYSCESEDGYSETFVNVEITRKMNDEEYFQSSGKLYLSNILPNRRVSTIPTPQIKIWRSE